MIEHDPSRRTSSSLPRRRSSWKHNLRTFWKWFLNLRSASGESFIYIYVLRKKCIYVYIDININVYWYIYMHSVYMYILYCRCRSGVKPRLSMRFERKLKETLQETATLRWWRHPICSMGKFTYNWVIVFGQMLVPGPWSIWAMQNPLNNVLHHLSSVQNPLVGW